MNPQLEKIRDVQRDSWNKSSAGWKKWDPMMMRFLSPVNDSMLNMVKVRAGDYVLDVASGTGEPGLTVARGNPEVNVVAVDLAEDMLKVAREHADAQQLRNFETVVCDAAEMPFRDETFDLVFCRHGFMFFGDMVLTLAEMMRVLKPGGAVVASVWDVPDRNPWICDSMKTMVSMLNLNPPSANGPGIFRCTEPGMMQQLFGQSGLKVFGEKIVPGYLPCESFGQYWEFISEVASPTAFKSADAGMKEEIRQVLYSRVMKRQQDSALMLEASSIIIGGIKQ